MNSELLKIMRQRGKVVALLVVCGTIVSVVHESAAGTIFTAISVAAGALAGMEAYAATKGGSE